MKGRSHNRWKGKHTSICGLWTQWPTYLGQQQDSSLGNEFPVRYWAIVSRISLETTQTLESGIHTNIVDRRSRFEATQKWQGPWIQFVIPGYLFYPGEGRGGRRHIYVSAVPDLVPLRVLKSEMSYCSENHGTFTERSRERQLTRTRKNWHWKTTDTGNSFEWTLVVVILLILVCMKVVYMYCNFRIF